MASYVSLGPAVAWVFRWCSWVTLARSSRVDLVFGLTSPPLDLLSHPRRVRRSMTYSAILR